MVKCQGKNKKLLKTIDYGLKKSIRLRRISILNSDYCILYSSPSPYPQAPKPLIPVQPFRPPCHLFRIHRLSPWAYPELVSLTDLFLLFPYRYDDTALYGRHRNSALKDFYICLSILQVYHTRGGIHIERPTVFLNGYKELPLQKFYPPLPWEYQPGRFVDVKSDTAALTDIAPTC